MEFNVLKLFISVLLILSISGCSYIKGLFPDKERDYQLTTEIPALVIPEDLTDHAIQKRPKVLSTPTVSQSIEGSQAGSIDTPVSTENEETINVDLVEYAGGATRIRIEDTIERSWRTVGKALSRNSIEIVNRNEFDRLYYVQYDPDFKKVEDGSLWDEVIFVFADDPAKEKEFRIRLAENGGMTEVIVLDSNDTPLSTGGGLKLLHLLYKTIKADLANKQ
ncbi:MAG: outer membrane protein assembly factor BamC [Methylococcaceae bacterium]